MTDYLAPIGSKGRCFALIIASMATLISAAMVGILVAWMIEKGTLFDEHGKPLWLGVGFLGFITLTTGWMTVRLCVGVSANGVTLMPVWFIEAFGALMLAAMMLALFAGQWHILLPSSISMVTAMLLIRRQVRRRLREQNKEISEPHEEPVS